MTTEDLRFEQQQVVSVHSKNPQQAPLVPYNATVLRNNFSAGTSTCVGWVAQSVWRLATAGVFNLSDSAGHINNFNDARGPQSYT
jgi:hypothetical protein